jgi:hypothetical protein
MAGRELIYFLLWVQLATRPLFPDLSPPDLACEYPP